MLLTIDLHEYFIDEKCIAETLMTTLQPLRILWAKLVTPQTNRFIIYDITTYSQQIFDIPVAQIEPIIEPDGVLNDFGWKSMTFVLIIGRTHYIIVAQPPLICQYLGQPLRPAFRINRATLCLPHWWPSSLSSTVIFGAPYTPSLSI